MFFQSYEPDHIVKQIKSMTQASDALAVIMVGEKTEIDLPAFIQALNQQQINFVGGVFPGVIVGNKRYEAGIAVTTMPALGKPVIIKGLNHSDFSLDAIGSLTPLLPETEEQLTALVLVDGLTTNIELMLTRLFKKLNNRVTYIGGGAGSLSFQQKPCVFDNEGVYQDAAVVALLNVHSKIGVRHGWRDLRGPFIASHTNRNVVLKLNNQPAFKKYSEIVKLVTGKVLNQENFFDIAKGFPLGLFYKGIDRIVRDPITFTEDGGLVCVGLVPEHSLVYILTGNNESLISHAKRATTEALSNQKKIDQCFVVDCISRVLYLQDQFSQELSGVLSALPADSSEPIGILTLGEIGSYATGSVEFFNKTIVVCAMQHLSSASTAPEPDKQFEKSPG
jgi:hypothetical protein